MSDNIIDIKHGKKFNSQKTELNEYGKIEIIGCSEKTTTTPLSRFFIFKLMKIFVVIVLLLLFWMVGYVLVK